MAKSVLARVLLQLGDAMMSEVDRRCQRLRGRNQDGVTTHLVCVHGLE